MGYLIHDVYILLEMSVKTAVQFDAIFGLLLIQEKASIIKVFCPVVSQLVKNLYSGLLLAAELRKLKPGWPEEWHLVQCLNKHLPGFIFVILLFKNDSKQVQVDAIDVFGRSHFFQVTLDLADFFLALTHAAAPLALS